MFPNKLKRDQKKGWGPSSSSNSHSQKIPIIQRYTNYISLVKQFIFDLGLIGLVVLGLVLFFIEVFRYEIILDPIEVPDDIAKSGYSGIVVAEQLADAALNVKLEIQELSARSSWHRETENMREIGTSANSPDISVPGSQFSMRFITRFIRQEFGLQSDYLRGELVHKNNYFVLTLRNLTAANIPAIHISKNDKEIEQLFQEGGAALLRLTDPKATAIYAYHKFKNELPDSARLNFSYVQAEHAFSYCLKYPPKTDDILVRALWARALLDLNRPEKAFEQYRKATEQYLNNTIDNDPKYAYYAYTG